MFGFCPFCFLLAFFVLVALLISVAIEGRKPCNVIDSLPNSKDSKIVLHKNFYRDSLISECGLFIKAGWIKFFL